MYVFVLFVRRFLDISKFLLEEGEWGLKLESVVRLLTLCDSQ